MSIRRPTTTPNRPKFQYRSRTADDLKSRASQGGTARDGFISQDVKFFAPKPGPNRIRILPPTWVGPVSKDRADHFGYEVFVHYGVGSDNSAYLCLDAMRHTKGVCPVCKERGRADAAGEEDYAIKLRPTKRICVYVVDRDRPQEGVLLWSMPWTVDRDLCARAVDRMTGEVYNVDDPEGGYDVSFSKDGQGQTTKYVAIEIARRSSPLSDDPEQMQAWLDYVVAHPIPDQLTFHEPDYITKIFSGAAAGDEARPSSAPSAVTTAPGRVAAQPAASVQMDDAPVTEADVMKMDEEQVLALIDAEGLTEAELGDAAAGTLEELKLAVCANLWPKAKAEVPKAEAKAPESLKDKLARLRKSQSTPA